MSYAAKHTSPLHKGHILVKRGNSSIDDIYKKLTFLSTKIFFKFRVSVLPFQNFHRKLLLKFPSYAQLLGISIALVTITHFSLQYYFKFSYLFTQKSLFVFRKKRFLNFRKQPSLSASIKQLLQNLWRSPFFKNFFSFYLVVFQKNLFTQQRYLSLQILLKINFPMSYFSEETYTKNRIFEKKGDSIEDSLPAISEIFERLTGISFQYSYPWLDTM